MPDHVHMLLSFKPKYAPADIVKYLKGHSAKRFFQIHPEIRDTNSGEDTYGAQLLYGYLGNMSREVVENYIRNQYSK